MSNGMPSMTALLGMLALAGYQNRDKISEMLGGATAPGPVGAATRRAVEACRQCVQQVRARSGEHGRVDAGGWRWTVDHHHIVAAAKLGNEL